MCAGVYALLLIYIYKTRVHLPAVRSNATAKVRISPQLTKCSCGFFCVFLHSDCFFAHLEVQYRAEILNFARIMTPVYLHSLSAVARMVRHAFFPPTCALCGTVVEEGRVLCPACVRRLEPARLGQAEDNSLVRSLLDRVPVVRAMSMLRYRPDTPVAELLLNIKYYNRPQLALTLGRWMAQELMETGIFEGVDAIVPMPLTPRRQRERGYNQSERLAQGISEVTGIPVRTDVLERVTFGISQTLLAGEERRHNVADAFRVSQSYEREVAEGGGVQHPLLLDDVITTGSSMSALWRALQPVQPSLRLSVISLALAGRHAPPYVDDESIELETSNRTTRTRVTYVPD